MSSWKQAARTGIGRKPGWLLKIAEVGSYNESRRTSQNAGQKWSKWRTMEWMRSSWTVVRYPEKREQSANKGSGKRVTRPPGRVYLGSDDKEQGPIPRLFPLFSSSFFPVSQKGEEIMASTEIRLSEAKASAAECQEASCPSSKQLAGFKGQEWSFASRNWQSIVKSGDQSVHRQAVNWPAASRSMHQCMRLSFCSCCEWTDEQSHLPRPGASGGGSPYLQKGRIRHVIIPFSTLQPYFLTLVSSFWSQIVLEEAFSSPCHRASSSVVRE